MFADIFQSVIFTMTEKEDGKMQNPRFDANGCEKKNNLDCMRTMPKAVKKQNLEIVIA